jgi:hypothetical protein
VKTGDIYWLAGILEGEGSFQWYHSTPAIRVEMTDKDVIEKAAALLNPVYEIRVRTLPSGKESYRVVTNTSLAIQWMMTLYPLMGRRRQESIEHVLLQWRTTMKRNKAQQIHDLQKRIDRITVELEKNPQPSPQASES